MKTGNLNGVDLTSDGAGTNYLADDGTYKAVSSGSQDLQSVLDVGNTADKGATFGDTTEVNKGIGNSSIFRVGQNTSTTNSGENGFRVNANANGSNFLDFKTALNGRTYFRTGQDNEYGYARTWLEVLPTNGEVTVNNDLILGKVMHFTPVGNPTPGGGDLHYDGIEFIFEGGIDVDGTATISDIPTGTQEGLVGYDANGKLIQGSEVAQDLESVLTEGNSANKPIELIGQNATGESILIQLEENTGGAKLTLEHDETNSRWSLRTRGSAIQDLFIQTYSTDLVKFHTSSENATEPSATFYRDVIFNTDIQILGEINTDTTINGELLIVGDKANSVSQPTSWVNGGFAQFYGNDGIPSGKLGVGMVQTIDKAIIVAGAFGTATSNSLEIQAANSSGVEQVVATFKDDGLYLDAIPTGTQVGLVGYDANGKLIQGSEVAQDLESVLTEGKTSTLGATFGASVSIDRQNDTQKRYHQYFKRGDGSNESVVIYSEGDGANGVNQLGFGTSDGNNILEFDTTLLSTKAFGDFETDGSVSVGTILKLGATTNGSPSDGDVWRDSSDGKLKFRENGVTYNFN